MLRRGGRPEAGIGGQVLWQGCASVLVELLWGHCGFDPWEELAGIPICRIVSDRKQVPCSKDDVQMNF